MRLYRLRLWARISGQAPKEVAERAYRDSMVEEVEVFAVWQVYTRCSRSGQQLGSDGVDKGIQSRAPNLYELLYGLCPGWAAMPEGHNATHVMSILSVICFTKHQRNVISSLVWWVSISSKPLQNHKKRYWILPLWLPNCISGTRASKNTWRKF